MKHDPTHDAVARVLRRMAERLEAWLDGDELALETLGEALEQERLEPEDYQVVIDVLRNVAAGPDPYEAAIDGSPGAAAQRVPSAEERITLSPEAWGYVLDLRRQGALDPGQFERVVDILVGCGVRPVDVELARDVASRVALESGPDLHGGDGPHGDLEVAH